MTVFKNDWMETRSLPFSARFKKYPFRTLVTGVAEHIIRGTFRRKTFFGEYLYIPYPEYRSILYHGMIDGGEIAITEHFWNTLKKDDIFFDVGTNIGFYSLLASTRVKEVHSFEPFPSTYKAFLRNLRPNIVPNNIALLDKKGVSYMKESLRPGLNRVAEDGDTRVEATTLDEYCESTGVWPTVMKIDIEGSELNMLRGATKVLQKGPSIVIELVENEKEITQLLGQYGYKERPFSPGSKNTLFVR